MADLITYHGDSKVIGRICELLNSMTGVSFRKVQTLPQTGESNVIYLVPKSTSETDNVFDEYIWIDNDWELIGDTEIDLSDYYTKTETDDLLDDKADTSDIKDGTLTIQLNGTNEQTFTANSSSNKTANIKAVDWESNRILGAKNRFTYPYYHPLYSESYTVRNVTYTESNGIISVSGTCDNTGNSYCQITRYIGQTYHSESKPIELQAGRYILTGGVSDKVWLTLQSYDKTDTAGTPTRTEIGSDTGSGLVFEVTEQMAQDKYFDSFVLVAQNYATQGEKIKPMIRLLSDSDNTWQPYSMTNQELTNNKASKEEAEKVKQVFTDTTNTDFSLIGSYSNSQSDETNSVNKIAHAYINGRSGNLTICRKHTATTLNNNTVTIGNNTPEGTSGNVNGILKLFGKGEYYVQFYDQYNYLTANRNYLFRNINGMLSLFSDVTDYGVKANLNVIDNLIYPIYFHSNGSNGSITFSTNFETGEYTVKGSNTSNVALNLKRYTQGFYLSAGKYKLSGCPSGGSSSKYSLRIYSATEQGQITGIGSDYGSGLEFTLTERTLMQIVFYVNANNSVDFTFRPKLEKLSDWVDLGSTNTGTITVNDVYSEYMAEVTLNCNYGGTTYTRNFMYNFLSDSLSSTAKSFIQTAPCQTQQIGGVVYIHCSTSAKKENNQVTIASGGTWTGGIGGTASPIFSSATIQLYAKV